MSTISRQTETNGGSLSNGELGLEHESAPASGSQGGDQSHEVDALVHDLGPVREGTRHHRGSVELGKLGVRGLLAQAAR